MQIDSIKFRDLVKQHQSMVFSIALRVTGEFGVAEEVAQDAFLELHRSGERLESEDHIRFWLRRVTVHRATDALRSRSRRPESAAEEWMDEQHTEIAGSGLDFGIVARLDELLRALPETMRVAVVLRYQEEMLPDEIAAMLGQPVATVKSNLQRGLQLLRRKAATTMKEYVRAECNEVQDEFEQELGRRMRRVDPPEGFADRLMERAAAEAPAKQKVLTMPRRTVFRAWIGGAIAATLVAGVFTGTEIHRRAQERKAEAARQQFETAMDVTDHALDHTRASLQRAGLTLSESFGIEIKTLEPQEKGEAQ